MKFLYELLPIIIFFVVFKIAGIYAATASAMVFSLLQVLFYRLYKKSWDKMQLFTLFIIVVLGSATLLLHNPIFIKWKPTIIYWGFAIAFLVTQFFGKKTLIQYALGQQIAMPDLIWRRLNIAWAIFFVLLGGANLYVAYHFSTNTWVNFKLFGMLGLTVLFIIIQAFYLSKHMQPINPPKNSE